MNNILSALNNMCNDSEQFFVRTQEIASKISSRLNCYCSVQKWGNYTYSDKITLFFHVNQPCTSKPDRLDYDRTLCILVSARGPYYTFRNYTCKKNNNGIEFVKDDDSLPAEILDNSKTITTIFDNYNLELLNDKQLFEQIVDGQYTELDSAPATVFEVLFGEVI